MREYIDIQLPGWMRSHFYGGGQKYTLDDGEIRQKIGKIDDSAKYFLAHSYTNPQAVEYIEKNNKKVLSIEERIPKESHRTMENLDGTLITLDFKLKEEYLVILHKLLEQKNIAHKYFDLVGIHANVYGSFEDYPTTHIVKGSVKDFAVFRETLYSLNSDEAFSLLEKKEGQWKYTLAEIITLREKKITPLTLDGNYTVIGGQQLRSIIDLVCRYELTEEHTVHSIDND